MMNLTFEEVLDKFDPNKHRFICSKKFYDQIGEEHKELRQYFHVDKYAVDEEHMLMVDKELLQPKLKPAPLYINYPRINRINGNLVKAVRDGKIKHSIIVHGCNCLGIMGAGIAAQFKDHVPVVYAQYRLVYLSDSERFGASNTLKLGSAQSVHTGYGNYVINGMTQQDIGGGVQVDYDAIRSVFKQVNETANALRSNSINFPLIGCGLAGGDWDIVSKIIEEEIDEKFTLNLWVL